MVCFSLSWFFANSRSQKYVSSLKRLTFVHVSKKPRDSGRSSSAHFSPLSTCLLSLTHLSNWALALRTSLLLNPLRPTLKHKLRHTSSDSGVARNFDNTAGIFTSFLRVGWAKVVERIMRKNHWSFRRRKSRRSSREKKFVVIYQFGAQNWRVMRVGRCDRVWKMRGRISIANLKRNYWRIMESKINFKISPGRETGRSLVNQKRLVSRAIIAIWFLDSFFLPLSIIRAEGKRPFFLRREPRI